MVSHSEPTGSKPALKLLAVSFAYPPLAYPRSSQVARLLKYSEAATVLVCADEPGARRDETIAPEAEKLLTACLRVPASSSSARRLADRVSFRLSKRLWSRLNMSPDRYTGWKTKAVRAACEYIDSTGFRPSAIVTFAQPFTDHLVGLELKRRYGIPWIAHFSDPWTDNPFNNYDAASLRLNLELERRVVEEADRTIFTSRETVSKVFAKYTDELQRRAHVLPQCFDPELYGPPSSPEDEGPIVVRYLGNFYGTRSPEPLCRALSAVQAETPETLNGVRFEIIGANDAQRLTSAGGDQLPAGLLTLKPPVAYRESLRLMAEADGLLVIDAPAEMSVFLPSKLIDYIGAGRPIMGLTPPGAASALIEQLGGFASHPSDTEAARIALQGFLALLRRNRAEDACRLWGVPDVRRRYESSFVAGAFDAIIRECVEMATK